MKSFRTFITEENAEELSRLNMVDALNKVKDECQQYLHRVAQNGKFHALYVGLGSEKWPDGEIQVRKNKMPLPTPKRILDSFDRVMGEMYGQEFRTDSFIATGNPTVAAKRGVKHIVFPIGKHDYLWSEKVVDLINGMGSEDDITEGDGLYFDMQEADDLDKEDKVLKSFLKDKSFVMNKDMKACADKGHDVMIDCKYYYAIPAAKIAQHYEVFQRMIGNIHFKDSRTKDLE